MTKKPAKSAPTMEVKVFSPSAEYYSGPALSVSALNPSGPFDILPFHANFLALLSAGEVKVNNGYRQYAFKVDRGLVRVADNRVTVFVGF